MDTVVRMIYKFIELEISDPYLFDIQAVIREFRLFKKKKKRQNTPVLKLKRF